MTREPLEVNRETLYEQVWATPMSKLAKQYGLSDRGLAKVCERLQVPVPGRGFWERLRHGYSPRRPELPELAPGRERTWVGEYRQELPTENGEDSDVQILIAKEKDPTNLIRVPSRLGRSHELVRRTRADLHETAPNGHGLLFPKGSHALDTHVSKRALPRALRTMEALVKALEQRGFKIDCRRDEQLKTTVALLGEHVRIRIEELQDRSEIERRSSWGSTYHDYKYTPNGKLALRILDVEWSGLRQNWRDGQRRQIETQLNAFIIGLIRAASHERTERLEREARHREWLEQERRREEIAARQRLEAERVKALDERLAAWRRSRELRAFMRDIACEQAESTKINLEWHVWLEHHASALEKTYRSSPSSFD